MKKTETSEAQAKARLEKAQKTMLERTKARIGGNKDHGWGEADSMDVIEHVINEEMPDGYVISEEALGIIALQVNPSAQRQRLESKKFLNESKGTRSRKNLDFMKV